MLYIVLTTGECNLKCKYCGGSFPPSLVPWKVEYPLDALKRFIEADEEAIVAFYGGEPLLNHKFIEEVMDNVKARAFVIQTNGTLVSRLKPEYWRKMNTVLLSIDGRKEVTDYYRGKGIYDAVLKAAKYLRQIGFKGDLIARMAVSEQTDIYADVTHLLSLNLFDHVHWQLDVVWSNRWKDFKGWVEKSYKPGLRKLFKLWLKNLRRGKVLGIVPFLGVLKSALFGEYRSPPCGAGSDAFAILTNGKILACPIAIDSKWAVVGHISTHTPKDVKNSVLIGEPCKSCEVYFYCGGRCLFAYKERYWGDEGFNAICNLNKYLVGMVLSVVDEVAELLSEGVLKVQELYYPPFNNTTEIIP